jgi:hypothetical protein
MIQAPRSMITSNSVGPRNSLGPPKSQSFILEPLQDHEVIKDAKCTIGNEFLVFCGPEGARDALNLKFSDIENQITQCYMGEDKVICNIKKDTELATLSAGIAAGPIKRWD